MYQVVSNINDQIMQFARVIPGGTKEERYWQALVVMGLSFEARQLLKTMTSEEILTKNGYRLEKI